MRLCIIAFVIAAVSACNSNDQGDDAPPDHIDAPQGAVDAPPGTIDAPTSTIDAPTGTCSNIAGTWGITGSCGADMCVITQTACSTQLTCGGGASSYTGSITGNMFTYMGTTSGGVPASCSGTVNSNLMSGSCTVAGVPCTFNGQRL
jgi:hypothetical protein